MLDSTPAIDFDSAESFQTVIDRLYARASSLEKEELEDFAAAERYIQQSYEGRSLFELIQNGRDAAQLVQQPGHIELELVERAGSYWLLVSNSGQPFTPAGVSGITRIGKSTKADAKTIGFKGIGFKAVKQLTDAPRVVTQWGTLQFDAELTRSRYLTQRHQPAPPVIPLFRLPHYVSDGLAADEVARGIATRVELPLRDEEARTLVEADLASLTARQLVLLGMVRQLTIRTPASTTVYAFEPQPANRLNVVRDGVVAEQYRLFEPTVPVTFPVEMLTSIGPEEREIMERMSQVDVRLLLPLDNRGRFVAQNAPLYLFYPLRLLSGFRFLIHSFFLVDPARTTLRPQCRSNEFLLRQIGQFIGGELVTRLVTNGYDTTEILCYQRISKAELTPLYDEAQRTLREAAFICLRRTDKKPRYFRPADVICASPALASLLPSGRVAQQWVVPVADQAVRRWLRTEFEVPELTLTNLGQQLELECERQAGNIAFFQHLYQFLATEKSLDLKEHRVLLTQQHKVVAGGQQTVFYRTSSTARVDLTKALQRQIHLLHDEVQLTEVQLKALEARTGLREMEPDALAAQLLRLMANEELAALRPSILRALKDLARGSERARTWFPRVWLPVQGNRWVQPLKQPVYVEREELRQLYPRGLFANRAAWPQLAGEEAEWDAFLLQVGAWDKPGLYLNSNAIVLPADDPRNEQIRAWKGWSTTLQLQHDRLLHMPVQPTEWFTQQLLTRWPEYRSWLSKTHDEPMHVASQMSGYWHQAPPDQVAEWCGATRWLRTASWVVLPGQPVRAIPGLVGIVPGNMPGNRTRLAENFLHVWRLDPEQHQAFIRAVQLAHLNARHLTGRAGMRMVGNVLQLTARRYPQLTTVSAVEFEKFYNMLLGRLQEYWEELPDVDEQKQSLTAFRSVLWLARHGDTGQLAWQPAGQLLYLDDKPAYEQLLNDLRGQPALLAQLPPQFYYQFTKHYAQGFGRLAQHLGQSFTSLVRRTLRQLPPEASELLLASQLMKPEVVIRLVALLEGKRQQQFAPVDLARLGTTQIVATPTLIVAFRLAFARGANNVEFELEQPYFLARATRSGGSTLYVQATTRPDALASVRTQRATAEALAALLAQVLNAPAQHLRQALPNLLGATRLEEFDLLYELSTDRLAELRADLYPPQETPESEFWQAVRRALGLPTVLPDFLTAQPVSVAALLAGIPLATDSPLPAQLRNAFAEGVLPQSAANRALLLQLLQEINLSAAALNAELTPAVTFDALLEAEWEAARQRYQPTFEGLLHAGLTALPAEQSKYLRYLAQYEQLARPSLPHEWQPDYARHLLVSCARDFAGLLAGTSLPAPRDADTQYQQTLNALRAQAGRTAAEAEQLTTFLQVPTRRSLLFFGQQQKLSSDYAAWLRSKQVADASYNPTADVTPPSNPAGFGQAFSPLVTPPLPPPSSRQRPVGGGGGAGSRESQQARDRIGRLAEERVWVWLRTQGYREVTWVSANAQKVAVKHPAHNPRGTDDHHYDLQYLNEAGEQVAVEVKGTSGNALEFYLSREELLFAEQQPPGRYRLLFITQVLDDQACRLYTLENPFLYTAQEDCWHNTRFRAEADTVRVAFQLEA